MSKSITDIYLTHGLPDCDGDLSYEMRCGISNPSEDVVELIWGRTDMYDHRGLSVYQSEEVNEDYLEPGEESKLKLYPGYFNQSLVHETPENVKASLTIALCKAEVLEYPILDLPKGFNNNLDPGEMDIPSMVGESLGISGMSLWANKPDEDGEVSISSRVVLTNKTSHHIYRCNIKARVVGANGREIAESVYESEVPYEGSAFAYIDIWNNLKPGQLAKAKLHLVFTVFPVVYLCTAEKFGSVFSSN